MNNNEDNKIVYLRIDDIMPNRFQPREVFDETGLEELSDSIKEHGVIQPIIVRQVGNKYELIAGERRTKASALAGLTTIPAIIKNMDDKESAKVSLLENLQRKNLTPIEEARTYKRILELDNMTQEDLAKTMGKSQPMVANKLRLLALPEEVQDALLKNQISERHARSLLNVKDKPTQLKLLDKIKNERLTVRELDNEIKNLSNEGFNNMNTNIPNMNVSNQNNYNQTGFFNNNPLESSNYSNNFSNLYETSQVSSNNNTNTDTNTNTNTNTNFINNVSNNNSNLNNNFNNNSNFGNNISNNNYNLNSNFNNNSNSNLEFNNNFNNSFNNMGLNDYKSSISGFNNMPNNFNNMSYDNNYQLNNEDNSSLMENVDTQEPNNLKEEEQNNNFSLGSMFDGGTNNSNNQVSNDNVNQNDNGLFVSNIRESNNKPAENKFLPNFSNNVANDFSNNETDNFSNDSSFNDNNLPKNDFNMEPISNSNSFTNFQSLNTSISNSDNQGNLFNQPLNIVNVPNVSSETDMPEDSYQDNNKQIDNPFDNAYQNILFAKPVSVNPQSSSNEPVSTENSNNNNINDNSNSYVSIDHQRTLFSTRDAVLELKKTTDRIKDDGINLDSEEIDFDDYYQIIIKIKK